MNNKVLPFPVNSRNNTNLKPSPGRFVPETDVDRKVIAFPAQGNTRRRRGLYLRLDLLPLVQEALAGEPSMRAAPGARLPHGQGAAACRGRAQKVVFLLPIGRGALVGGGTGAAGINPAQRAPAERRLHARRESAYLHADLTAHACSSTA